MNVNTTDLEGKDTLPDLPSHSPLTHRAPSSPVQDRRSRADDVHDQDHDIDRDATLGRSHRRRGSSASRVAIDHFDPTGVYELKRTLTSQSQARRSLHPDRDIEHDGHGVDVEPRVPPVPGDAAVIASKEGHIGAASCAESSASTAVSDSDGFEQFNLEKHLKGIVRQADEQEIMPRELGVVFRNLRVQGLGAAASFQPTLGSTLNPLEIPGKIRQLLHPPVRDILSGFEGVVRPGEMLLVLGRPGAGCSTLLKTLANQHGEYHNVSGLLRYSSFTSQQVNKRLRGDVIYCPEDDVHFPTLTVSETLTFAARTRAPTRTARLNGLSRAGYVDALTDILGTVFGLRHVKDTKVGNAAIRGVSGGERKRVSIAEALATRAKLGCWDNSTRGLDASTALEFVRALRIATDVLGLTSIVSIYQASETLYTHFDKVCVISEGRMIYFGPANAARDYFTNMGWAPAPRQTTADFLVAVTDPNGRTINPDHQGPPPPRTSDEMAAYFRKHELMATNRAEIAAYLAENVISSDHIDDGMNEELPAPEPHLRATDAEKEAKRLSYMQSVSAERARHRGPIQRALKSNPSNPNKRQPSSPFTLSVAMQVREVVVRRVQILRGNWAAEATQLFAYVFQAIIMGTLFLKVPESTAAYFSRGGVLFFAILFGALSAMAEIPALFAQRPIVNRHYKAAMYHPFTEALALTIVDVPITVATIIIFSVVLYFLVGLQKSAGQFFIFYLFVLSMTLTMKAFFRALAAAFKRESSAQSLAGVSVLAIVLYTGYTIPKPSMIGALRWITYLNPTRYGFESILTNEFHTLDGQCSSLVPQGPGYENVTLANQVCTTVGSVTGQSTVNGDTFVGLSYGYSYSNLWRNFGITVAFAVFFVFVLNVFTEMNTSSAEETAVTLYKRGSKSSLAAAAAASTQPDEEKGSTSSASYSPEKKELTRSQEKHQDPPPTHDEATREEAEEAMKESPTMTNVFTWQHLKYTVPIGGHGETRRLLDDVSGYVAPGKLTALMGESGAGKTTLLNVLAGRAGVGVISGDRFVNGQPLPHDFQAQTGYCQQMDTHLPETTVREALLFSANLRQPQSVPLAEKEAYVETCLKMCGLEDHADAIVGTLGVEHKKRTTIGVELAAKPSLLLFLDEPTSGLDSQSAWAIMAFLRSLADHGQAILCTIHQPSSELFQVFDRLLLLRKGGQMVYFGDLGANSSTLIKYFESNGGRTCAPEENPAEWMLDVIGAGATASSSIDWHETWNKSSEKEAVLQHLDHIHAEGRARPPIHATRTSEFATSWGFQLYTLSKRAFEAYWRNPTYLIAKLFLNIAAGLFIGFTFFKAKDSMQGAQNKIFAIFMATILSVPLSNQLQAIFIDFRNIYEIRERPSQMYSWTALVASQYLVEIPWNILGSSLFFLCWFWTVGFQTDRAGYTYLVYSVIFPLYYTSIAQAIAAMAPDAVIAAILFSTLFSFVISFNGVLQPYRQLNWWKWMYRVSPFTYLIEGLVGQAVGRSEITCASTELVQLEPPSGLTCSQYMDTFISTAGGYIANPNATSECLYCSARTSDAFLLSSFNISYDHHWRDFGILAGVTVFNVFAIFALTYLFRIRTRSIFAPIMDLINSRRKK